MVRNRNFLSNYLSQQVKSEGTFSNCRLKQYSKKEVTFRVGLLLGDDVDNER